MNTNQGMYVPPPYTEKINEPLPTGYHQQVLYPNPTVQQGQPLPMGNPTMMPAGDYPMTCNCPYCHQSIVTKAEKDYGLAVWLSAGLLCLFGCFFGCCLIPFCVDGLKDTIHYCPNCNRVIAKNQKL